jgi:diguanylate cyclase (GGDEF)-like protein
MQGAPAPVNLSHPPSLRDLDPARKDALIRELVRKVHALETQSARQRSMLDFAHEAILQADLSGRIDGANRAAEDLFGHVLGQDLKQVIFDHVKEPATMRSPDSVVAAMPQPHGFRLWKRFVSQAEDEVLRNGIVEILEIETPTAGTIQARLKIDYHREGQHGHPLWLNVSVINTEELLRDPLTGLHFRRTLTNSLERDIGEAERLLHGGQVPEPISLLFVDADHFKRINDTLGHLAGDRALRWLSSKIRREMAKRPSDLLCRYGGEELVLKVRLAPAAAVSLAERLRIAATHVAVDDTDGFKPSMRLTVSVGVATWKPGEDVETLLQRADRAVYAAKDQGRNRVVYLDD